MQLTLIGRAGLIQQSLLEAILKDDRGERR